MDLVSQIVATKGKVALEEIKKDLHSLHVSTSRLKNHVLNGYNGPVQQAWMNSWLSSSSNGELDKLMSTSLTVDESLQSLLSDDLIPLSEKSALKSEFQILQDELETLDAVRQIEECLKPFDTLLKTDPLSACVNLSASKEKLENLNKDEYQKFKEYYLEKYCSSLCIIKTFLIDQWLNGVSFKEESRKSNKKRINVHKLSVNFDNEPPLDYLYECLTEIRHPMVKKFGETFFDNFLKPVLTYPCELDTTTSINSATMSIRFSKSDSVPHFLTFHQIVPSLTKIFNFLNEHLNFEYKGLSFIQCLGSIYQDQVISLLINQLSVLDKDDLENSLDLYSVLHKCFLNSKFISDDTKLREEMEIAMSKPYNIPRYLFTVFIIIQKNPLDSIETGPIKLISSDYQTVFDLADPSAFVENLNTEATRFDNLFQSVENKWIFPKCRISKWMTELIRIIEHLLEESLENVEIRANLWHLVHEIINLYLKSPRLHSSSSRHTVAALVFNNSMLLAVKLIDFEVTNHTGWPLCTMVPKLQALALSEMNRVIKSEQDKLSKDLNNSNNSGLSEAFKMEELPEDTEEAIKGCLKQLQSLSNDWSYILPTDIYCSAIGFLCDEFLKIILLKVQSAPAISTNMKTSLNHLCSYISENIKQMFEDTKTLEKYVKEWGKWKPLS